MLWFPRIEDGRHFSVAVEQKHGRAMVERIARLGRHLAVLGTVGAGDGGEALGRPGNRDNTRIEGGHVLLETGLRVPIGIDGDEHDLDAIAVGSQSFQIAAQVHQRGRADVRAKREAEEKRRRQAGNVAFGERSTVLGEQIEGDTRAGHSLRASHRGKKHDQDEETGACDSPSQQNRGTFLRRGMVPPAKPEGDTHGNLT